MFSNEVFTVNENLELKSKPIKEIGFQVSYQAWSIFILWKSWNKVKEKQGKNRKAQQIYMQNEIALKFGLINPVISQQLTDWLNSNKALE